MTVFRSVRNNAEGRAQSGSLNNTTDPVTFSLLSGQGAKFPADNFFVTAWSEKYVNPGEDPSMEVILCTSRVGDALTCTRAQQGTSAVAHTNSPNVALLFTAAEIEDIHNAVNAIETGYVNVTGDTMTGDLIIQPTANSVTTLQVNQADGTNVLTVDTTNVIVDIGGTQIQAGGAGLSNVFIGSGSGRRNTTGSYNNALGYQSLYRNTTGNHNNALGCRSLYSNTIGYYNNALGPYSLYSNTTGSYNNALGLHSLYYNQTGSHNQVMGYTAGGYGAGAVNSFSNSVLIGSYAGYNITTGSNNILLGYKAGENITSGTKNIVIGYDIDAPAINSTNTLNIGNLIYATGLDGSNGTLSTGNVGIGMTGPGAKLQINTGAATIKGLIVKGAAAQSANLQEWQDSAGNVGVHVKADFTTQVGDDTDNFQVSPGGIVTLAGTAKRHLTLRPEINIDEIKKQLVPDQVQVGVFFGYSMPIYIADSHEELYFRQEVPGRWDEVSDIVVHLVVALSVAEDVGDNFKFQLSWNHVGAGSTIPIATHDVVVEQAVLAGRAAQYDVYDVNFTIDYDIDGVGNEIVAEELLACRVRRLDATNPDVSNEIIVVDWDVHYQVDKMFKP